MEILFVALLLLILASAFFSGSETAMLSLNRHRLKQLAKQRHGGAQRVARLLANPERLLGVIRFSNKLVTVLAASLATLIALRLWGETGIFVGALLLTVVLLTFADMTPKTIGATHPESLAFPSAFLLHWLLRPLHPVVALLSATSNRLVRLLGFTPKNSSHHQLSPEELRTLVGESAAHLPAQRQNMLLNILDLEKVTVNDIMVPRNDVSGIDLEGSVERIRNTLLNSQHTRLPVFTGDLNKVAGILHMRNAAKWMQMENANKAELMQLTHAAYFVPESTPLPTQLVNFQKNRNRIALVVDEYGDVIGLVTLEDILEEIVGNFTTNLAEDTPDIYPQEDGTYLMDGTTSIRDINRALGWHLPTDGPKTINGLLMEELENIPETQVGIRLYGYCAEILQTKDHLIKSVRMWTETNAESRDSNEIQASLFD